MRNFIEKFNFVKKIKDEREKRERWKDYSSILNVVENNNFKPDELKRDIVEEKNVEIPFKTCSFSPEGCRGEYYDENFEQDEYKIVSGKKGSVFRKIKEGIEKRNSWKDYSSILNVVENNNFKPDELKRDIVEEKNVEIPFKTCSFSPEGCRGEYYDEDVVDYNFDLIDSISKKINLIKKSSVLKFNLMKKTFNNVIKVSRNNLSSVKNFRFNFNLVQSVKNGFNVLKDSINKFSFNKVKKLPIEFSKLSQSDGDVIDRTEKSEVAVVLNNCIKVLKKCHLIKDNKFTQYIENRASAKLCIANISEISRLHIEQDNVVWYTLDTPSIKKSVKRNNLISIINLHKPQNQAYLVKGLTAASLTVAIGLGCAGPVNGLVSMANEFLNSEIDSKQVVTEKSCQMDNDDYIMLKTYGEAYDINTKMVNFEYYKRHTSSTMNKKVTLESEVSNIDSNVICIGDCVTTNSNTIYKGVSDASDKVNGLKAAYSCDKVREVELIGLDYEGKIIYSSDQKVIDEYRMKGAVDTAYLTYIDDMCEGYFSSDNVKKLVKKL